jgi:hypothetical protein
MPVRRNSVIPLHGGVVSGLVRDPWIRRRMRPVPEDGSRRALRYGLPRRNRLEGSSIHGAGASQNPQKIPSGLDVVGELSEVHVREREIRDDQLDFRWDRSKRAKNLPIQFAEVHKQHRLIQHRLGVSHRAKPGHPSRQCERLGGRGLAPLAVSRRESTRVRDVLPSGDPCVAWSRPSRRRYRSTGSMTHTGDSRRDRHRLGDVRLDRDSDYPRARRRALALATTTMAQ